MVTEGDPEIIEVETPCEGEAVGAAVVVESDEEPVAEDDDEEEDEDDALFTINVEVGTQAYGSLLVLEAEDETLDAVHDALELELPSLADEE